MKCKDQTKHATVTTPGGGIPRFSAKNQIRRSKALLEAKRRWLRKKLAPNEIEVGVLGLDFHGNVEIFVSGSTEDGLISIRIGRAEN